MEQNIKKIGSFSLIERVILSAGAMLIFSVSFQIDQMPEGEKFWFISLYISRFRRKTEDQDYNHNLQYSRLWSI